MDMATDMFLYLGRESDLDNSLVECTWDRANRSTRNFQHYEAMEWRSGNRPKAFQ